MKDKPRYAVGDIFRNYYTGEEMQIEEVIKEFPGQYRYKLLHLIRFETEIYSEWDLQHSWFTLDRHKND
jgi:hypothetical protein